MYSIADTFLEPVLPDRGPREQRGSYGNIGVGANGNAHGLYYASDMSSVGPAGVEDGIGRMVKILMPMPRRI